MQGAWHRLAIGRSMESVVDEKEARSYEEANRPDSMAHVGRRERERARARARGREPNVVNPTPWGCPPRPWGNRASRPRNHQARGQPTGLAVTLVRSHARSHVVCHTGEMPRPFPQTVRRIRYGPLRALDRTVACPTGAPTRWGTSGAMAVPLFPPT